MLRARGVLIPVTLLMLGCVDTAEPTGPAPPPPGDEGELTSAVVTDDPHSEADRPPTAARPGASR